ncbi:cell division protein FtsB [Lysobacteraceae bacterium NML75-0749]|nr:cell division protein FtsB [Xanthomonadaceae bacterium NML75-0749]PJK04700.1 cell division protein FtsB [Xanthomonadaceae bacterium NML71-0210]PJK05461.1 cell division protein FtsB [Xanthomonadaceae bacterium NML91-0268]
MPKRHLALIALILLGILAWLQYQLWFGVGGKREVAALVAQLEAQQEKNQRLQLRNEALAAEVDDLKGLTSEGAAIEERARDEFGLIKPGETFYRVVGEQAGQEQ